MQAETSRMRGRPREFDPEAVVESAMHVFWSRGYHATALPDLLEATKLSRGSLYAAFGDKHGLFLRALDRYIDDALVRLAAELDPCKDPLASVRSCLVGYVNRTSGALARRGCLVVATTMEMAAHDPEVEQRIRRFFETLEARLAAALGRAKAAGQLADGVEPATVARMLLCLLEGMRVVAKTAPDRAASKAVIEALVTRLAR